MYASGFADPPGLRRCLPAVGAALVLHGLLLAPLRFSVTGAATVAAPPSMTVRMLVPTATTQDRGEQLPPVAERAPETVATSSGGARPPRHAQLAVRPSSPSTDAAGRAPATDPAGAAMHKDAAPSATAAVPPALAPAPSYRSSGMLDPGPQPLHDITPEYPARAGQQQGRVVLRLLINERGLVDNVAVVRAEPRGFFEESALEAYGSARFSPGMLFGLPVKSQMLIEVEFATENRGASVSGRTY